MKNKLNIAALVLFGLMTSIANAAPMGWTVDSSIDRYNSTDDRSYLLITNYSDPGFQSFQNKTYMKFDVSGLSLGSGQQAWLNVTKFTKTDTNAGPWAYTVTQNPMDVGVYNMNADVGAGAGSADIGSMVDSIRVTADGEYQWNITSLVSGWIDGSITNNGIALVGAFESDGMGGYDFGYGMYFASSRYAGNGYELGDLAGPSITAAVPEPSTLGLMFGGLGLVGLMAYRSKKESV